MYSASSNICSRSNCFHRAEAITIVNHRTALQWPLEESFAINFSHSDFSQLATGFFHLRPPLAPDVPQWNLSAVLLFYEGVDHHSCPTLLLLLKTLCLTALASGNLCSELAHISRREVVDLGSSMTLPLMPRLKGPLPRLSL